jgi:hypothetical protein
MALVGLLGISACNEDDIPSLVPPTIGAVVDPNVGGADQPNQVFIDLSSNQQTTVARNTWDLAFYSGDEFRVILNNSVSSLARSIDKNDLNDVTADDTLGFGAQLDIDAIFGALFGPAPQWLSEVASWTDAPSGDLAKTAIAEVSANADENQVYFINRGKNPDGSARGWAKIRVIRGVSGYTLQYADINDTSFQELTITKSNDFAFIYASFDNGITKVAPAENNWDFVFTVFTNLLPINATTSIPYAYKDYVLTNVSNVEVATVTITADITYDDFLIGDIGSLDFSSNLTTIGSGWRTVAQPGTTLETGVKADIFYVIKDSDENYYKLKFTRLVDPNTGERGNPQFIYNLIEQ